MVYFIDNILRNNFPITSTMRSYEISGKLNKLVVDLDADFKLTKFTNLKG